MAENESILSISMLCNVQNGKTLKVGKWLKNKKEGKVFFVLEGYKNKRLWQINRKYQLPKEVN